jgi:hypothetical protein
MPYEQALRIYDVLYRALHRLEDHAAQVPPILCLEIRRSLRRITLRDGTAIRLGDPIGILHLDNRRLGRLHAPGKRPVTVGLEFRRALFTSLRGLACRASGNGPYAHVTAFAFITILHHGLPRIGFERDPAGLVWKRLTSAYQRALLAAFHPDGSRRASRLQTSQAERLWISRATLLKLYRGPAERDAEEQQPASPPLGSLPRFDQASGVARGILLDRGGTVKDQPWE